MTIKNFDVKFINVNGDEIKDEEGKEVDFRNVIFALLIGSYQDEQNLSGVEKFNRAELAKKIKGATEQTDFTTEELASIKDIAGRKGTIPVVHQAFNILESK